VRRVHNLKRQQDSASRLRLLLLLLLLLLLRQRVRVGRDAGVAHAARRGAEAAVSLVARRRGQHRIQPRQPARQSRRGGAPQRGAHAAAAPRRRHKRKYPRKP
jgi:hypothetical protein